MIEIQKKKEERSPDADEICSQLPMAFIVRNNKGQDTGVRADGFYREEVRDMALVRGNFRNFYKVPVELSAFTLTKEAADKLTHCGYANGVYPFVCSKGTYRGANVFKGTSSAMVVPGMSGGPVFDEYGIAVGINSSADDEGSAFALLIGLGRLK